MRIIDRGVRQILRTIQSPIRLRAKPIDNLSEEDVNKMLENHRLNFFDKLKNPTGTGIIHQYEPAGKANEQVIIDHTTGLTWEQSGSVKPVPFEKTQQHIKKLNKDGYGGYSDWRLPTLEEAMSLMTPEVNENSLHINPIFDKTQQWLWTTDKLDASYARVVHFINGYCYGYPVIINTYVRAVR